MNTKVLMSVSALIMGLTGIIMSFLPQEVLKYLTGSTGSGLDPLIIQLLGALYFAFGMVNWMAKGSLIGGIYARPIAIGNLTHFMIGALALLKGYSSASPALIAATVVYIALAILFGIVFFRHPVKA
jgi:hypothetical protein